MQFVTAIAAAIKGKAPIVALPMEGHAPLCLRQKLLKGVLKGVEILTAEVIVRDAGNRALKITGRAGNVRTSCTLFAIDRRTAQTELAKWADKERAKAEKKNLLGALATSAGKKAAKLAEFENEGDPLTAAEIGVAIPCVETAPVVDEPVNAPAMAAPCTPITWHMEQLAWSKAQEWDLLHPQPIKPEGYSALIRSHRAAYHAVPRRIVKACSVVSKRLSDTIKERDALVSFHPYARPYKKPRIEAATAKALIALVQRLLALRAEYVRIAPPPLLSQECGAIPTERRSFVLSRATFNADAVVEERRRRAARLRMVREEILHNGCTPALKAAMDAAIRLGARSWHDILGVAVASSAQAASELMPLADPVIAPARKPRKPSPRAQALTDLRHSPAFEYLHRMGSEAKRFEFLSGYARAYQPTAEREYVRAMALFQTWGGSVLTAEQKTARRRAQREATEARSAMHWMRGYESLKQVVDRVFVHARESAHQAFRAHPELRDEVHQCAVVTAQFRRAA